MTASSPARPPPLDRRQRAVNHTPQYPASGETGDHRHSSQPDWFTILEQNDRLSLAAVRHTMFNCGMFVILSPPNRLRLLAVHSRDKFGVSDAAIKTLFLM